MRTARWIPVCLVTSLAVAATARTAQAGTGREQEAFADQAISRMKENASAVRTRLGGARSSRDSAQTVCLDAKLTQLEVVERQAEDARSTLRRASLREDMDAMAQASAALTRLDGRARELRARPISARGRRWRRPSGTSGRSVRRTGWSLWRSSRSRGAPR